MGGFDLSSTLPKPLNYSMELHIKIHALSTLSVYKIGARTYLKGAKKGNSVPPVKMEQLLCSQKKEDLTSSDVFWEAFYPKILLNHCQNGGFFFAKKFDV